MLPLQLAHATVCLQIILRFMESCKRFNSEDAWYYLTRKMVIILPISRTLPPLHSFPQTPLSIVEARDQDRNVTCMKQWLLASSYAV